MNTNNDKQNICVVAKGTNFLSTKQFAAKCGLSRNRIFILAREGRIRPIVGMGKGYKWTGEELEGLMLERL
jgi:hypothetical protein